MINCNINPTPIFREDGRIVAIVRNNALIKHVKSSVHMLKKPRGWAWDDVCIEQAEKFSANQIQIIDDETNLIYSASLQDFHRYGISLNHNFGSQTCLPIKYWQVTFRVESSFRQLSLF